MASVAERNQRLDALSAAVKTYATKQREQLKQRVATAKNILKGRTGSERLAQASVQASSDLVVAEVDEFLLTS